MSDYAIRHALETLGDAGYDEDIRRAALAELDDLRAESLRADAAGAHAKDLNDALRLTQEALREMRELAAVSYNGDPWYADQEGIDAAAIFDRARLVLRESN